MFIKAKLLTGGVLAVLLAAGITRITYRMIDGAPLSVHDYGARGDWNGVTGTDDTTAIQATITAAKAKAVAGKPVGIYVPAGTYKVSAPLVFYDQAGLTFSGAGAQATQFAPTTALAGLPVLLIRNVRDSVFKGFFINGVSSGAGAHGIEIRSEAAGPNGFISTANKFDDITIGGTSVGIADGVRITDTLDVNNDKHEFTRSVRIRNFTGNGIYIGHINALWERIDADIDRGPVGVWIFAGAADMNAVWGPQITDTEVKVGGGGGFGLHPITISGNSEQNVTNTVKILSVSDANTEVRFNRYERQGGATSATNLIDWTGATGYLEIVGSRFNFGQINNRLNIVGAGTTASITGSRLGFDVVNYSSRMMYANNTWVPGAITENNGGAGTYCHVNETGAQFATTPTICSSGMRWSLGPSDGYFSSTGTVNTLTNSDLVLATALKGFFGEFFTSRVSGDGAIVKGRTTSGQSKVAVQFGNAGGALTNATDKIGGFYPGDPASVSPVATVGIDGRVVQTGSTFANLAVAGTVNGTISYCSDCTIANPCAGGGTGAFAKRLNGVWVCN